MTASAAEVIAGRISGIRNAAQDDKKFSLLFVSVQDGGTEVIMNVLLWLIIALAAGIIEACTTALVSVWIVIGAICAACVSALGGGETAQVLVFLITSLALLIITAPLGKKFRNSKKVPTNADMLIGCVGEITEDVDPVCGKGEVIVKGRRWSVRLVNGKTAAAGDRVIIKDIVGAHLVAEPENNSQK